MSWRDKKDKEKDLRPDNPFDFFKGAFGGNDFFEKIMNDLSKMMSEVDDQNPNTQAKRFGPYVWGYNMTIGPDGKPEVRQFSNMNPGQNDLPQQRNMPQLETSPKEPLVDVFIEPKTVKVIAEIPGVKKEDIKVFATDTKLKLSAKIGSSSFNSEKEFGVKIKPLKSTSEYKNGILELVFDREEPSNEDEFEVKIL